MKFSILILSIPERLKKLSELLDILRPQCENNPDVEILVLTDNRKRSVGSKRSSLLQLAQGEYLAFIDDDDLVSTDYVDVILKTLRDYPDLDVLTFTQIVSFPNGSLTMCKYSVNFQYESGPGWWRGLPAHTMVWKRDLVKDIPFPNKDWQEDLDWCKVASKKVTRELIIEDELYHYRKNYDESMAVKEGHKNERKQ